MYTVFRNIRPPPLDQFDLRDMTAREAEICEGDLARSDAAIIARANIPSFLFHNLRKFAKRWYHRDVKFKRSACYHKSRGFTRNHCETKSSRTITRSRAWSILWWKLRVSVPRQIPRFISRYTRVFSLFFFFFNSPVTSTTRCTRDVAEVSKVFATLSPDPWHKGRRRRVDEENNPATVRWIDMMRTYVDMWGCTRLITPEASWDAERLKRPYPLSPRRPFGSPLPSTRIPAAAARASPVSLTLLYSLSLPYLLSPVLSLTLSSRDVYQPSLQTYRISTPRFPNWRVDKLVLQPSWVPVAGCSRMHCLHRWEALQTNRSS